MPFFHPEHAICRGAGMLLEAWMRIKDNQEREVIIPL